MFPFFLTKTFVLNGKLSSPYLYKSLLKLTISLLLDTIFERTCLTLYTCRLLCHQRYSSLGVSQQSYFPQNRLSLSELHTMLSQLKLYRNGGGHEDRWNIPKIVVYVFRLINFLFAFFIHRILNLT